MAHEESFTRTKRNLKSERIGLDFLCKQDSKFRKITTEERKLIMEAQQLDQKFRRAFDMIYAKDKKFDITNPNSYLLIEVKVTRKHLPEFPKKFFFGATKNEFDLAEELGKRFRFCLLCMHPDSQRYILLTKEELEEKITRKRIQYQIDL